MKQRKSFVTVLVALVWATVSATSFSDDHADGVLTGWTIEGNRGWSEASGAATPASSSSESGFLINNSDVSANGTLEVEISAHQWNGASGGVVFRWTSPTSFYYVTVLPAGTNGSYIKFCKNNLEMSSATTIANDFAIGTTYTLKVVMEGANFSFYIDDTFMGQVTDSDHASGKIGYGYSAAYSDYIDYNNIVFTAAEGGSAPTDVVLSNVTINEGEAVGTIIGDLSATDSDVDESFTYTLVNGIGAEDNTSFTIDGTTLKSAEIFDYGTKSNYSIRVEVTDKYDLTYEQALTVRVNQVENYADWTRSTLIHFNTTATGADVTENVENYPLCIILNSANHNFANSSANGSDIRFADPDGTQLPYEIESWDDNNQNAVIWVRVPMITGNSDQDYITMYYGNSGALDKSNANLVFDNTLGFTGVWHFDEEAAEIGTTELYRDATQNEYHGTDYISSVDKTGRVGKGITLDGENDYISLPAFDNSNLDAITLSAWIKLDPQDVWADIISKEDNGYSSSGFGLRRTADDQFAFTINNGGKQELFGTETAFIDDGANWYYVTGVYSGTEQKIYINGEEQKTLTGLSGAVIGTSQVGMIGKASSQNNGFLKAVLDEMRISSVARSAAWIKLNYENQKANQQFVVVGSLSQEVLPPSNFSATVVDETSVVLYWNDNANNETNYEVSYSIDGGVLTYLATLDANSTSYTHLMSECGKELVYTVKAYNAQEASTIIFLDASVSTTPCQPTSVTGTQTSSSEILLSWDSGDNASFVVEVKEGVGSWGTIYSGTNTNCLSQGVKSNTLYTYRVKAISGALESTWSSEFNLTSAIPAIDAPSNLSIDNSDVSKLLLAWNDNSSTEEGFKVYRKKDGANQYEEYATVGTDVTSYSDMAVECEESYSYYVVAYNATDASGASNMASATTLFCGADKPGSELIRISAMYLDDSEQPVTAVKNVFVNLYTSRNTAGTPIYSEEILNQSIKNGFVSVVVGYAADLASVVKQSENLYYDIIIDGQSIFKGEPQPVTAAPYTIKNQFNLHGEGSPIGSVAAPVGASYVDTENYKLYMKSGEQNTDWIIIGQ